MKTRFTYEAAILGLCIKITSITTTPSAEIMKGSTGIILEKIHCDSSVELSQQDGPGEGGGGTKYIVSMRIRKKCTSIIIKYPLKFLLNCKTLKGNVCTLFHKSTLT